MAILVPDWAAPPVKYTHRTSSTVSTSLVYRQLLYSQSCYLAVGAWACNRAFAAAYNEWLGQSTLEWQDGSSINRFSTWVAGKHAWIGVHGPLGPVGTLTGWLQLCWCWCWCRCWCTRRQVGTVSVEGKVLVCCWWCRAGEIPYAPRPAGLAHGGNRRNRNLSPVRPQRIG